MRYVRSEEDCGLVFVTVMDSASLGVPTERTLVLDREAVLDILRTVGRDPCAHLGRVE